MYLSEYSTQNSKSNVSFMYQQNQRFIIQLPWCELYNYILKRNYLGTRYVPRNNYNNLQST